MLIDHERQYVFIHIPKTAGQSVVTALGHEHRSDHHSMDGIEGYGHYLRCCFVRHPVTRFLSAYRYSVQMALGGILHDAHPIRAFILDKGLTESAQSFVGALQGTDPQLLFRNLHFKPQVRWVMRGRPHFIGRFEDLETDLRRLQHLLGIPPTQQVPTMNPSRARPELALDADAVKWIQTAYARDLGFFGYTEHWVGDPELSSA